MKVWGHYIAFLAGMVIYVIKICELFQQKTTFFEAVPELILTTYMVSVTLEKICVKKPRKKSE